MILDWPDTRLTALLSAFNYLNQSFGPAVAVRGNHHHLRNTDYPTVCSTRTRSRSP